MSNKWYFIVKILVNVQNALFANHAGLVWSNRCHAMDLSLQTEAGGGGGGGGWQTPLSVKSRSQSSCIRSWTDFQFPSFAL